MIYKPRWSAERWLEVFSAEQRLFTTELGQKVLGFMYEEFAGRTSFGDTDRETNFMEGERSVIIQLQYRAITDLGDLADEFREADRLQRARREPYE